MTRSEEIAILILNNEALEVRSRVQDWLRSAPRFRDEPAPSSADPQVRAVAAAVVELLAERAHQAPPTWTSTVGPLGMPLYLVAAAHKSEKLRARVERESPEPLRRRRVYAPPGYLELV